MLPTSRFHIQAPATIPDAPYDATRESIDQRSTH